MGAFLDKAERRLGFIAIPGLALFIAGMHGVVGLMTILKPQMPEQLALIPELVRHGQVWRCLSFILIPPLGGGWDPLTSALWLFLWVPLVYSYLVQLEAFWGDFRFTVFCLLGAAATSAASLAKGMTLAGGEFHLSLFLAFSRLNPNYRIMFFFAPLKARWIAAFCWFVVLWDFLFGSTGGRVALAASLANYLLFFGASHWLDLKNAWRRSRYQGRF